MKKIIINTAFVLSIFILFASLLLLTVVFLWENRGVIARNFGVKLEDNCRLEKDSLVCGYVKVQSERLFIDLKTLKIGINIKNFIERDEPFINLQLKEGFLRYTLSEKKRKLREKNPLNLSYFLIYFVKSDIDRFDAQIIYPNGKKLLIKDFSFINNFDIFRSKKPFYINFNGLHAKIEKLKGSIAPDEIVVEEILTYLNNNPVEIKGSFDYQGNFAFSGSFYGKNFKYMEFDAKNFRIETSISRFRDFYSASVRYSIKGFSYRNTAGENIQGVVVLKGVNTLKGSSQFSISKLSVKKNLFENIASKGDVYLSLKDKRFAFDGKGKIDKWQLFKITVNGINSNYRLVYHKKRIEVEGDAYSKSIRLSYILKNKKLTVKTDSFYIKDLIETAGIKNKLAENIDGTAEGTVSVNLEDKTTTVDFKLSNINLYGINYREGSIFSKIDNREISGSYTVNLKNPDGFGFINGTFKRNYIEGDVSFDNLNLNSLIYGKKFKFGGVIDGNGYYSGYLPDIKIQVSGVANSFRYRKIQIKNYNYQFGYFSDIKKMELGFKSPEKRLTGNIGVFFSPFSLDLNIDAKNADLSFGKEFLKDFIPNIFSYVTPLRTTGFAYFHAEKKKWNLKLNLSKFEAAIDMAQDTVKGQLKGFFSNSERDLFLSFGKKNFRYRDYLIKNVNGKVHLQKNRLDSVINADGLNIFDSFKLSSRFTYLLDKKYTEGKLELFFKKEDFHNNLKSNFSGKVENIKGKLSERGYVKDKNVVQADIDYSISNLNDRSVFSLSSKLVKVSLPENINLHFYSISGKLNLPYKNIRKTEGSFKLSKFTVSKNYIYFFDSSPVHLKLKDNVLTGNKVEFTGIIRGKLENLRYDLSKNTLRFQSDGQIDRNFLSMITQYVNSSGDLNYHLRYNGKLDNVTDGIECTISSEELGLKTAFTIGIIQIKKFLIEMYKGDLNINIYGKSPDIILGESVLKISGTGNIRKRFLSVYGQTRFFPVKYMNIFQGNINSDLRIKTYEKKESLYTQIKGDISVSGKVKLEKDMNQLLKSKRSNIPSGYKNENLERVLLDIKGESYIPLYLYGKWGKAYAEFNMKVKGTASSPVVDGDISIIYGEIYFMKNRYNIDFANIKIIKNEPYISARISTSIADTFIFIDLSGSLYEPRINFSSSPPKSRDEILSILLLRDTPSALENMPVFKTVGKILYAVLPFKPAEERGLFNTGFEINILPQYSPTAGISASVYAKRNLTRRIFVALSKPIGQVEEERIGGWYGVGLRLKERSSFQYKFFETGNQEFDIVFSFPFDF
ncbi:Family of unknown function [Persephonella hydrogeniphila]|uniref:Translocation and assembly module TamB C-terminal domain-containing protein n=1 Tax=Persephonella hydrogeniphila TaxID=198703 RepID=A0A285NFT2_9AQUI|nr:translocation/assembly module TamB domain-containing protein [Persephonella hydrogeniphila]SNZ07827.1 Family of unknown function [Persephonella hydrogeniphila]